METATQQTGSLASKLALVMAEIDHVEKRGWNKNQSYKFMKATDLMTEVRSKLAAHNIAFSFDVQSEQRWEVPTHSGGKMSYCSITAECKFHDGASGDTIAFKTIGWGSDVTDKAPYKAITGALKYGLRTAFLVPDESDPENDSDDRRPDTNSYHRPERDADSADNQRERIAAAQGTKPSRPTIIEANRLTTAIQTCEKVHNPKTGKSYLQCTYILHDPAMGRGQEGRASVFENKGKPGFIETVMAHKGEYVEYEIEKKESGGKQYINIVGIVGKVSE
jgi:hypothetical protein